MSDKLKDKDLEKVSGGIFRKLVIDSARKEKSAVEGLELSGLAITRPRDNEPTIENDQFFF